MKKKCVFCGLCFLLYSYFVIDMETKPFMLERKADADANFLQNQVEEESFSLWEMNLHRIDTKRFSIDWDSVPLL